MANVFQFNLVSYYADGYQILEEIKALVNCY